MPSSSARCSQLPRAVDKVPFYAALRKFKDHLKGELPGLDESEITFPDVVLKTAIKKEPKEENSEQYPGEVCPDPLSQFTENSYQVIPHQMPQSAPTSMSSVPLQSNHIQPYPSSQPSNSTHMSQVLVKQEPVDQGYDHNKSSQSETMSLGQFEVYNHSGNTTQGDNHLNNFLNGLYGLVDQVADGQRPQSTYGMVNQTGISSTPLQFNDALRDIVKVEDEDEGPVMTELSPVKAQKSPAQAAGKPGRPRKRKSKTNISEEQSSLTSSPVTTYESSSHNSSPHLPHMSASPPQMSIPTCIPSTAMPPYASNMQYNNFTPYTSHMTSMPFPSQVYSNSYPGVPVTMPHAYPPYMNTSPQNGGMPGYPYPLPPGAYQANMAGFPGQPGMDPNVTVKQEKPEL